MTSTAKHEREREARFQHGASAKRTNRYEPRGVFHPRGWKSWLGNMIEVVQPDGVRFHGRLRDVRDGQARLAVVEPRGQGKEQREEVVGEKFLDWPPTRDFKITVVRG